VQAVGGAQAVGGLGVGGDPGHRGGVARAAAQDLVALGRQARRLGRGQALRPGQPGQLAEAVAHSRVQPDAEQLKGPQRRERGGEQRRVGEPRSGQPAEQDDDPSRRSGRNVDPWLGCRSRPARPQQPGGRPGLVGQLVGRGGRQGDPQRRPAVSRRQHAERQVPGHLG
jgi:hypothetical protein